MSEEHSAAPSSSLLRNTLWRLGQIMAGGGFAVLVVTLYTANLSKADFAAYGAAITINQLLQLAANFGFRQTIARFIAKARGENRPDLIRSYTLVGAAVSSLFSGAVIVVTLAISGVLTGFFQGREDAFSVVVLAVLIGGTSGLSLLFQGVLEGLGAFKKVMLLNVVLETFQIVVLLSMLLFGYTVTAVLWVELCVMVVSILLYGIPSLRDVLRHRPAAESCRSLVRTLVAYGVPVFLNSVGGFLYTKVDVLFVKHYLTPGDTADYFLMMYVFNFPLQALGAYIFVLNTEISVCLGRRDRERIWHLFKKSEWLGFKLGLVLAPAFVLASYILPLFFPEYSGAGHLMRLISPMVFLKCISHMASGAFMLSMGWVKPMAAITIVGGLLNVTLNFLFIPSFGVDGAVYSTILGHTLTASTTVTFVVISLRRMVRERE